MQSLYLPPKRNKIIDAVFGSGGLVRFWEDRFLPRWLPLSLALAMGFAAGFLIARERWTLLFPLLLATPVTILFVRYPFASIMLWMLILPYFVSAVLPGSTLVFWLVHGLTIPAALVLTVLSRWAGITGGKSVRFGWADLSMVAFLGLAVANVFLLNPAPTDALARLYVRIVVPFCVYWLLRTTAPTERDLKRFLWVAAITLFVQCFIGVAGWFSPGSIPSQWTFGGYRTIGTLVNPAVYSSTIVFLSLLLLQLGMQHSSKLVRYALITAFGLTIFCVFISFSRGSWLSGLAVLGGLALLYPKTIIRLIAVSAVVMFLLGNTIFAQELAFAQYRLNGEAAQVSASNRTVTNNTSILMIQAKPVLGWGFDTYDRYYLAYVTRVGDVPAERGINVTSHNTYLTIMAELGIVAFLLYMFPVARWLFRTAKIWRELPKNGFLGRGMLGVLWLSVLQMFIVTSFMDMIRFFPFGTTVWWMALGLIANIAHSYSGQNPNLDTTAPRRQS